MEIRNFTPFPTLAYQALDRDNGLHHIVAMRQTLSIDEDGALRYSDEQEALSVTDEYFGEMNRSSVRRESDLAPIKLKCDVIVVATAFAPGGIPTSRFDVNLRILRPAARTLHPWADEAPSPVLLDKTLAVTGPRFWQRGRLFGSWKLSDPEPIISLPLRYEYAYGGELRLEDAAGQQRAVVNGADPGSVPPIHHSVVESNPVGLGFREDDYLKATGLSRVAAPQIEDPCQPVETFGAHYPAQGFGVITKAWLPRRQLAGTADDAFAKSDRWLPEDFDFAFWNGAHPDLQIPYLQGDELVELTNLTASGMLRIQLPGHRPYVLVRYEEGNIEPVALNLDTLFIDTEAKTVAPVYRLTMPVKPEVRVLEARLVMKEDWDAGVAASQSTPAHRAPAREPVRA